MPAKVFKFKIVLFSNLSEKALAIHAIKDCFSLNWTPNLNKQGWLGFNVVFDDDSCQNSDLINQNSSYQENS